ncbi:hypothetical protein CXR25_14020 [Brevibacterium aurantiacum]|uniref:hypothetical protein n=1 Tax=Brevibacterium aurantiacum TaxID=273384 RepID=UPI000F653190|nr:hypothetical protein [Brevibacterium aurantiacum]AZL13812.1 hypothetical protein CXR25_14020 [Brevibacterium aurantiacum]
MTTTDCTVKDCTGKTHGRSYCGKHRDQIAKGYMPNQAPSRLVDSHDTRDLLLELKTKHSMMKLGRLLGVSSRTVARAAAPANVKIERTLAESIRFIAGEVFEPAASIEPVTGADVAAFALTDVGREFIVKCRRPVARKVAA